MYTSYAAYISRLWHWYVLEIDVHDIRYDERVIVITLDKEVGQIAFLHFFA